MFTTLLAADYIIYYVIYAAKAFYCAYCYAYDWGAVDAVVWAATYAVAAYVANFVAVCKAVFGVAVPVKYSFYWKF